MKRVLMLVSVLSLGVAITLSAQAGSTTTTTTTMTTTKVVITTDADYPTIMKEVSSLNGPLGKAIMSGTIPADAAKTVARLEALYQAVHGYWAAKKVADATTVSMNGITALQAMSKAIAANDVAAVTAARTTFAATCMACHTAHREKTEAGWMIK